MLNNENNINPFPTALSEQLRQTGVIAVLIIDDAENAVPLAQALLAGGITAMELTLRSPAAINALQRIRNEVPEMLAGVGTVLTTQQVQQAIDADAAFGVAPGVNRCVIDTAVQSGFPFAPGICTPSDIETSIEAGCRLLKFFPAVPMGGMDYLQTIHAPYAHLDLSFIPLGGMKLANSKEYLQSPIINSIGGSWIAPRQLIQECHWDLITKNARQANAMVMETRTEAEVVKV